MGYRSDVKMLFKLDDELKRDAFVQMAEEICKKFETVANKEIFKWPHKAEKCGNEWWLVEFNDVKWYTDADYDHVNAWEAVKMSVNDWEGATCEFMRVGEEQGDIEHELFGEGDADYRLYTNTEITVDL